MPAPRIVPALDVADDVVLGVGRGAILAPVQPLAPPMKSPGSEMAGSRIASLTVTSAVAPIITGARARRPALGGAVSSLIRSCIIRRALLLAFGVGLGVLWIGASVLILHELIGWWAALEYSGLTSTTQWPQ